MRAMRLTTLLSRSAYTERRKVNKLRNGDYFPGKYIYADGILTHVCKAAKIDGYTFYRGKIPGQNVVSDGKNYAHCK